MGIKVLLVTTVVLSEGFDPEIMTETERNSQRVYVVNLLAYSANM